MKVVFTKYAKDKFAILKKHSFFIERKKIKNIVESPDKFDLDLDPPKLVASKKLDDKRDVRVVYLVESDIIKVISFYPAERE